jgi:thiol:disulfide interchange protein DsbC
MLKKILLGIFILSTNVLADKNEIINNLKPFFNQITLQDISETSFKGVYEVINKNPIEAFFVSENGKYLVQGNIIDLGARKKMKTNNNLNKLKKDILDSIKEEDKIIFKAKNEKYIVHVFTDVDCPFCKKLHSEIKKMNNLGITVKYLASPLASLHPKAQTKMEKIWCAKNKVKAMNAYKTRNTIPNSKFCKNPVAEQLAIAKQLGVSGTPAIFLEEGIHIPGYLPAEKLLQRIIENKNN